MKRMSFLASHTSLRLYHFMLVEGIDIALLFRLIGIPMCKYFNMSMYYAFPYFSYSVINHVLEHSPKVVDQD